jgi:hypothetical protein
MRKNKDFQRIFFCTIFGSPCSKSTEKEEDAVIGWLVIAAPDGKWLPLSTVLTSYKDSFFCFFFFFFLPA